jgi:NADPH:quinone reductase-like Zn-dependent oxidoreductase
MRAVAVRKTGDRPELMELPVPRPAPGEVLVKLAAASVNPIDVGIAEGFFEGRMPHVHPLVLGVDGTGRVVEAGEGVRGLKPGDTVHGQFLRAPLGNGTFADYAVVTEFSDSGALQRVPDGMPADIAAALPTAGMTALGALEAIGPQAGQPVLIVGVTGGVGVFAVQLAAACGAEVIATARPDADRWIQRLGAAVTVDYTAEGIAEQVRKTHPDGIDALLDLTRDQAGFSEYAGLVRDGGTAPPASAWPSPSTPTPPEPASPWQPGTPTEWRICCPPESQPKRST